MNTRLKRRVAIGVTIWLAFAALVGALYKPPVRDLAPTKVAAAPASAEVGITDATDKAPATAEVATETPMVATEDTAIANTANLTPTVATDGVTSVVATVTVGTASTDVAVAIAPTVAADAMATVVVTATVVTEPVAVAVAIAPTATDAVAPAAAEQPAAASVDPALVTVGENVFQKTAGGVGCQLCHGPDATGLIGPNIVGKTADDIRFQFENNDQMKFIVLTNQEVDAVATYLQYLANPNAFAMPGASAGAQAETMAAPGQSLADPVLANGQEIFQKTAGGVGCQLCHGPDAKGLIGPNIVGKTADDIRFQFENNDQMKFIVLNNQEIEAVATYLQYLADPNAAALTTSSATQTEASATAPTIDDPAVAEGEQVFQVTAGGVGCQLCHGPDAKGLIGPNIVGKTADDIRFQFENNDQMKFITLTDQEIDAVAAYLQYLTTEQ